MIARVRQIAGAKKASGARKLEAGGKSRATPGEARARSIVMRQINVTSAAREAGATIVAIVLALGVTAVVATLLALAVATIVAVILSSSRV
jgi:hypothetical protein